MNEELWSVVFVDGDTVEYDTGEGPEGFWLYYEREFEVDGLTFRAQRFANEARTTRDLLVYSPAEDKWIHLGGDDIIN